MTLGIKDVKIWKSAFIESVQELGATFLGGAEVVVLDHKQAMPEDLLGSFVQIVCPEGPVLLGITGPEGSCLSLAKLMLGMAPEDELAEADAFDAMGELINIAAGGIKMRLAAKLGSIELGLPMFLSGRLRAVGHIEVELTEVTIGGNHCALMVFALTGK